MIQAGDADIVIAGGMENMSMAHYILKQARFGYRMGNAPTVDTMLNDALWDSFNDYHMGETAENVCELRDSLVKNSISLPLTDSRRLKRQLLMANSKMRLFQLRLSRRSRPLCLILMKVLDLKQQQSLLQDKTSF